MSIFKKGGKEDLPEREAKDFLEEHERLKQLKLNPQPAPASPASPPAPQPRPPQPAPAPAQPRAPQPPQPSVQPQAQAERPPIEYLIEAVRALGMDVKPVEALREYARLLDEKEKELVKRIEELEAILKAVRQARQTLRQLGV